MRKRLLLSLALFTAATRTMEQGAEKIVEFPAQTEKIAQAAYYIEKITPYSVFGNKEFKRTVTLYSADGEKIITYDTSNLHALYQHDNATYIKEIKRLIPEHNKPRPVKAQKTPSGTLTFFDKHDNELHPPIKNIPANIIRSWKTLTIYQDYDFSSVKTIIFLKRTWFFRRLKPNNIDIRT